MKIYTKKGDDGSTQLFGGLRVPKHLVRIDAYGNIDELNSHIGLLLPTLPKDINTAYLNHLQLLLFDIGSHLAADPNNDNIQKQLPSLDKQELLQMELEIDRMQEQLNPLKHFIIPGGSISISQAHICRTVCRRAERSVSFLAEEEKVSPLIQSLLNRLSDYFFVLARWIAEVENIDEIQWKPRTS